MSETKADEKPDQATVPPLQRTLTLGKPMRFGDYDRKKKTAPASASEPSTPIADTVVDVEPAVENKAQPHRRRLRKLSEMDVSDKEAKREDDAVRPEHGFDPTTMNYAAAHREIDARCARDATRPSLVNALMAVADAQDRDEDIDENKEGEIIARRNSSTASASASLASMSLGADEESKEEKKELDPEKERQSIALDKQGREILRKRLERAKRKLAKYEEKLGVDSDLANETRIVIQETEVKIEEHEKRIKDQTAKLSQWEERDKIKHGPWHNQWKLLVGELRYNYTKEDGLFTQEEAKQYYEKKNREECERVKERKMPPKNPFPADDPFCLEVYRGKWEDVLIDDKNVKELIDDTNRVVVRVDHGAGLYVFKRFAGRAIDYYKLKAHELGTIVPCFKREVVRKIKDSESVESKGEEQKDVVDYPFKKFFRDKSSRLYRYSGFDFKKNPADVDPFKLNLFPGIQARQIPQAEWDHEFLEQIQQIWFHCHAAGKQENYDYQRKWYTHVLTPTTGKTRVFLAYYISDQQKALKSFLDDILIPYVFGGKLATEIPWEYLSRDFNEPYSLKLYIKIAELKVEKRGEQNAMSESLKHLLTGATMWVNGKNKTEFEAANESNVKADMNDLNAVPAAVGDARVASFQVLAHTKAGEAKAGEPDFLTYVDNLRAKIDQNVGDTIFSWLLHCANPLSEDYKRLSGYDVRRIPSTALRVSVIENITPKPIRFLQEVNAGHWEAVAKCIVECEFKKNPGTKVKCLPKTRASFIFYSQFEGLGPSHDVDQKELKAFCDPINKCWSTESPKINGTQVKCWVVDWAKMLKPLEPIKPPDLEAQTNLVYYAPQEIKPKRKRITADAIQTQIKKSKSNAGTGSNSA